MPPNEGQHHDEFLRLFAVSEPGLRAFVRSLVPRREDVPEVSPMALYKLLHRIRLALVECTRWALAQEQYT
jgi:hypothetical protein